MMVEPFVVNDAWPLEFNVDAITLGCRRGHDQKRRIDVTDVPNAMRLPRRHLQRVARRKSKQMVAELDLQLAIEHEEDLSRPGMVVQDFARTRRDPFLNDTEIRPLQEAPAVANLAPVIVLCCLDVMDHG
jgi:hypothetical protein